MIETMTILNPPRYGHIFRRTLRDNLPGALAWGGGYSSLLVLVVFLYPILQENNTLLSLMNGLGLVDILTETYFVDPRTLGTFHGYLALEGLAWSPLILAVYLIPQAMRVVIEEEYNGTLDLLLSTPLPRTRLIVEKTLAVITSLAMILAIMWISLLISTSIVEETRLTFSQATAGIWNMLPICLTIFTITLALSVTLRSSPTVGGMAALIVIASLFIRSLADATSAPLLEHLRHVSMFHYYVVIAVLLDGIAWRPIMILSTVSLLLFLFSIWMFRRRDLGV
jgi:ABC-2 type transport system permease protein